MLGNLIKPECEELLRAKDWEGLRSAFAEMDTPDVAEVIEDLPADESSVIFRLLPRNVAADVFEQLPLDQQAELVNTLGTEQLVTILNEMAPDDRTRLFEELPAEVTKRALVTLRPDELKVARQLLGYPEKSAGRYMTPEYLAVRPTATVGEALEYIRQNGKDRETLNVIYVTDDKGRLMDDVRLGTLVLAEPGKKIAELDDRPLVSIPATTDIEEVVGMFEKYDRVVLPVTDSNGVLVGIITVDDVLDVAEQQATEDIQGLGGLEALDTPYLDSGVGELIKKRGVWLLVLFVAQMLTATVMGYFEGEIARATVLSLFIPLIMSSGGNTGSQATSLIIRAISVRDLKLSDWWIVFRREVFTGVALGAGLGLIGLLRILLWPNREEVYTEHYVKIGLMVSCSVVGVVLFGNLVGAMLPFALRRVGLDPAKASAPFVATLVDVTGLIIYFTFASLFLTGTLL